MLLERWGETVTLERPDGDTEEVDGVLCHEASSSDQSVMDVQTRFINQARYKGDQRTLTVLWPKSAPHDLMDCHLWVRGERYAVYSAPFAVPYSPNGYDMRVTATRSLFLYEVELLRAVVTVDEWGVPSSDYEGTTVRANLLRLSDDISHLARQDNLSRMTMFELEPDSWDEEYVAYRYQGLFHTIKSIDYAGDVVVVAGTREVTDA